jgi:translation initiation factor 4G
MTTRIESGAKVEIVDGREEHAPFIAWVMLAAARSHLDVGLYDLYVAGDEAETLAYLTKLATTDEPHFAHWSCFIVAEVDGVPAAGLCGYFDEERGAQPFLAGIAQVDRALGRSQAEIEAAWARAGSIVQVMPSHEPRAWIVEHVATKPEFRRHGLIDRLLAEILDRGRAQGATIADIGVLIGNDAAQRAYEKAGFAVVHEKCHPEFEAAYKCPGIRELSRQL